MGDSLTTGKLARDLASRCRVLSLGGLAVISHGFDRLTYDADIWLEPFESPEKWAQVVSEFLRDYPVLRILSIGVWEEVDSGSLAKIISDDGVVRVMGADQPLDIFRKPNELEVEQFEEVWERAHPLDDGTRLPDPIDLLVTKMMTDREKDFQDIAFLETKVEKDYLERLPRSSAAEAETMLARFLSPKVAEAALAHSQTSVQQLALRYLKELTDEGNPYARDILAKHQSTSDDKP